MRNKPYWLLLPAAAAAGAAVFFLRKNPVARNLKEKRVSGVDSAKASCAPKTVKTGSYSFISGFKDAATVELSFPYDAGLFHYSVAEDQFLVESGDSHVGILYGEDFSAQFEYGNYYSGENYEKLCQELLSKHPDLSDVQYGLHSGIRFLDGDSICLIFPIPEDSCSYLQISLLKAPDNDDDLSALPEYPSLRFILESMTFSRS